MTTYTGNCNQSIERNLYDTSGSLVQRLQQWFEIQRLKATVRHERRQLLTMSEDMLKDLGITHGQAIEEAGRTDLPEARLKLLAQLEC